MQVALPGLQGFDDDRIAQRRAERARRRPRRLAAGVSLLAAGPLLALWYAWDAVGLGHQPLDTGSTGMLRGIPFATVVVGATAAALVVLGGRLAVERDGRLSRVGVVGLDLAIVLVVLLFGATALLPAKFARSVPPEDAARRELPGRVWQPGLPDCQPAVDPTAFRPWIQDADVCGLVDPGHPDGLSFVEHEPDPSGARYGLYYAPELQGDGSGLCLRHLDGPWFAFWSSGHSTLPCPDGEGEVRPPS